MKLGAFLMRLVVIFGMVLTLGANVLAPNCQVSAQSGDDTTKFCMLGPRSVDTFPEMQISFRAYDTRTYQVPQNILASDIVIIDNGKPVTPQSLGQIGDLGLNVVFVVDQGNRTAPIIAKSIIQRFTNNYMVDGIDQVSILTTLTNTRRSNAWTLLDTTSSVMDVQAVVGEMPETTTQAYLPVDDALREAISKLQGSNLDCKTPSMIVMIMGRDEISGTRTIQSAVSNALSIGVPIHVLHIEKDGFQSETSYRKLASETGGIYYQVPKQVPDNFTVLDQPFFNLLKEQRIRYEASLRLPDGASEHVVSVNWAGMAVQTTENTARFNVALDSPVVNILTPTDGFELSRTAQQKIETGFVYDLDTQVVQFEVAWQDDKPRRLTSAELVVTTSAGPMVVGTFNPESTPLFEFNWDLREFIQEGQNDATVQVRVVDEYGYEGISNPVQVRILNVIPVELTEVMVVENPVTKYMVYGLLALVLVLLVLLVIFWRRLNAFMKSGKIGQMVEKARQTIVGGGNKKKPLAVLVVLDGPQRLINKELKIFTESATLGRDPQQADFTFYSDSNSTISGLHAKIERSNGRWRLVGISKSGNETFLDDQPIPNFEPHIIHSGQRIKMGYDGQQPVELEFREVNGSDGKTKHDDIRSTKVNDHAVPSFTSDFDFENSETTVKSETKESAKGEDDESLFGPFRDRK